MAEAARVFSFRRRAESEQESDLIIAETDYSSNARFRKFDKVSLGHSGQDRRGVLQ